MLDWRIIISHLRGHYQWFHEEETKHSVNAAVITLATLIIKNPMGLINY